MRSKIAIALALLLCSAPSFALTVYLDYDKDYDFSKIQTYQWVMSNNIAQNPIVHQRIVNAINYQLGTRGKRQVESDGDVLLTYYANSREDITLNTTDVAPPGWYTHTYYGTAMSGQKVARVGTLIVEATDPKTHKLVWRGTAEDTVKADPEKIDKTINKALEKMAKEWDKLRKAS
jgi:uncharacterized protein DUF4136